MFNATVFNTFMKQHLSGTESTQSYAGEVQ